MGQGIGIAAGNSAPHLWTRATLRHQSRRVVGQAFCLDAWCCASVPTPRTPVRWNPASSEPTASVRRSKNRRHPDWKPECGRFSPFVARSQLATGLSPGCPPLGCDGTRPTATAAQARASSIKAIGRQVSTVQALSRIPITLGQSSGEPPPMSLGIGHTVFSLPV